MVKNERVGFMQGRLSPLVDGLIQCFPWDNWQNEFALAEESEIHLMEWTLDQERLYENPLLTISGQEKISKLCKQYQLSIPSLTGDCFMQAPFWKVNPEQRDELEKDFLAIAYACSVVGIEMIVVPLVDNGRLDTIGQEELLIGFLEKNAIFFENKNLQVIFESDFGPSELSRFISRLPSKLFGINYDIGNSAALGYLPKEEFAAYGSRIINVHVKDRSLGGTTVPLGTGNADFELVFSLLGDIGYSGNIILQTARAEDDNHAKPLCTYRDMVVQWVQQFNIK